MEKKSLEMDNSFAPNEVFSSEKKVRISQRYTKFGAISITYVIGVVVISAMIHSGASYVFANLELIEILYLILGLIGIWALLALATIPFDWNMVVLSSDGIKFSKLTKRVVFKWKDIRSCSLRYKRKNLPGDDGTVSFHVDRTLTFKVTPLEGEGQSISIKFPGKLRFVFREEKEEEKFRGYIQSIVEGFTIESEGYQSMFKFHWVIREE